MWPFTRRPAPPALVVDDEPRSRLFTTHPRASAGRAALAHIANVMRRPEGAAVIVGSGMDAHNGVSPAKGGGLAQRVAYPEAMLGWFLTQGFMGYQLAAWVAQNWLVDKACSMPARDAVRHGFTTTINGLEGAQLDEALKLVHKTNKRMKLNKNMQEYIRMGRTFGIRIALFQVESTDPDYYKSPFNPDGVTPGSYRGISQIDPEWCTPQFDEVSLNDPASQDFYVPTWWLINGQLYHKSHLVIFRNAEPADTLKPSYRYGGIPLPQRIMERVYAAERTANEAPQLAMTKRLMTQGTDMTTLVANEDLMKKHVEVFQHYRDNYGIKFHDTDDSVQQFDTTLSGFDDVIMTQYQIVASVANVPATKLLGTTPKGFNSSGNYEESSYHEELETIQENDLDPLLERHLELVMRSEIEPAFGLAPGSLEVTIDWNPVDSPSALEYAQIRKVDAETDEILVGAGILAPEEARGRLVRDRDGSYTDLAPTIPETDVEPVEEEDEILTDEDEDGRPSEG